MLEFGWLPTGADIPAQWDLRPAGWRLCAGDGAGHAHCRHICLADIRATGFGHDASQFPEAVARFRLLLIGVELGAERARLIADGCGDALPTALDLAEVEARARRLAAVIEMMPRRRVGPLTLDPFHRDARNGRKWLALHPREFEVLCRLADMPGIAATRSEVLRDVWRISREPETNSVEVHISRLRAKLALAGCAGLIETAPDGGYRLPE